MPIRGTEEQFEHEEGRNRIKVTTGSMQIALETA